MVDNSRCQLREVSLPEAASILGMTREGVRRRLLKGRLEGRKSNETNEWVVLLQDELVAASVANDGQKLPPHANGSQPLQMELARLEERLVAAGRVEAELRDALADTRARLDRAEVRLAMPWWQRWLKQGASK
jgi:hypothetical protein